MKKSWTSVGLSLCMVLTLTPVTAIYADEFDTHEGVMDQEIVEEKDLDLVEEEEPIVEGESEEVVEIVESEPEEVVKEIVEEEIIEEEVLEALPMMLTAPAPVSSGLAIDETNFPDANFRSYVLASFDSNGDEKLDDEEIANVKYINAPAKTISNLKGIEYFTELLELNCDNNQLTSLDVSKNTKLVKLICSKNALTSLNTSHNPLLKKLDIYSNKITSIDVSQNTELETLYIGRNPIETLNVKNNVKLMELQSELNNLTSLDLSNNSPSMTVYVANNIYPITVGKGRKFDLSKLPAGFDVSKASNWQNATVNSGVLIVENGKDFVTYDYDCGNGHKVKFKFRVYSSIKQVSVPWPIYKYLYMNFYTYNGKEQVGVDAGEGYTLSGDYKATNAGKYFAKVNLLEGYEWEDGSTDEKTIEWEIREAKQDTPGGLQGVAPSSSSAKDGKITGTTSAMRYKRAFITGDYVHYCDDGETTGLEPGEYVVWYVKKPNYDASPSTKVIVPNYGDTTSKIIVRNGTVNGSDSLIVSKSDVATLVAKTSASYDKEFDKWVIKAGKATIKDVNSETTTITNGGGPVTVEAVYKDKFFKLNVVNGTGSGTYEENEVVSIKADAAPAGEEFDRWMITSGTAVLDNYRSPNTTITIKDSNVVIEALYKKIVPVHTHTYGKWSYDNVGHWQECTDPLCPNKAYTIKYQGYHQFSTSRDTTCNVCGYKRTLPTYNFIDGANGEWLKNSNKDLGFKTDGEFSKFTGVKVDGTLIGVDKYTAVTGSTLVTLKKDYLETLSVGKHTLTVVYTDGECTTEFEVKNKVVEKPGTEEDTKPGTDAEKPGKEDTKPSTNTEKPTTSKVDKKKDVKSDKKKSLNTAYSYNMGQWMALLLMSGFVLALTVFKKKRN